jgi:hypothetical protein
MVVMVGPLHYTVNCVSRGLSLLPFVLIFIYDFVETWRSTVKNALLSWSMSLYLKVGLCNQKLNKNSK